MPRNTRQRASTFIQMQHTSAFPFTQLSGELQLLILGECDPITAAKLLNLSPYLRGLYIRYPEKTIQAILSNAPAPVAALARVSLDLHNLADRDFDANTTLTFLQEHSLFEWHVYQPSPVNLLGDPLGVLSTMADFFLDVDEAARAIGECWAAGVETFLDPFVQPEPVVLSDSEYVRVASSLWTTQIYYQMRSKFARLPREDAFCFPRIFIRSLAPWQIDQCLSIDRVLRGCGSEWHDSLHRIANLAPTTLQRLLDSRYIGRVFDIFKDGTAVSNYIPRFGSASTRFPIQHTPEDPGHPTRASKWAEQLKNHAWEQVEPLGNHHTSHSHYYRAMISHVGFLFWDSARVPAAHSQDSDYPSVKTNMFIEFFHKAGPLNTAFPFTSCELRRRLGYIERAKARQIREWTRCTEQCTLEEWLYFRTNTCRLEQGRELLPWKYVTFGAHCQSCGADGHWERVCDSDAWSVDTEDDEFDFTRAWLSHGEPRFANIEHGSRV